jgi:hypothetical protein
LAVSWAIPTDFNTKMSATIAINGFINDGAHIVQDTIVIAGTSTREKIIYFGKVSGTSFSGSIVDIYIARGGFQQDKSKQK